MPDPGKNPYVGPQPFQPGQPLFGRDREVLELRYLLTSERIVLLYSPSGAGKSSLVNAGLLPKLQQRFEIWGPTRVNTQPPDNAQNRYTWSAISGLARTPGVSQGIPDFQPTITPDITWKSHLAQTTWKKNPLIIFDQFEEILRLDPVDIPVKRAFFEDLGDALSNPQIWALFIIREDYLAPLDPFVRLVPTHFQNRYRLDRLTADAASEAIEKPTATTPRKYAPGVVATLVENLAKVKVQQLDGSTIEQAGPYVEPLQLQVVCFDLWSRMAPDDLSVDPEDVGDVGQALSNYYEKSVQSVALKSLALDDDWFKRTSDQNNTLDATEHRIRDWFAEQLITPDGVRNQVRLEPNRSGGLDNPLIAALVDTYLVRAEQRGGSTWYELAHDRLVQPIRANNEKWFEDHLFPFQKRARQWQKEGANEQSSLLLLGADLEAAERPAALFAASLTPFEQRFLETCGKAQRALDQARKRRRTYIACVAAAILVLAALTTWAFTQKKAADAALAQSNRTLARVAVQQAAHQAPTSPDESLAYIEQALKSDPNSIPAVSWATNLLVRDDRWIPHAYLPHQDKVNSARYSPDGHRVLTASDDRTTRLWDAETGAPIGQPLRHQGIVNSAVFSPDGRRILTASDDKTAQIWDAATGQPAGPALKHTSFVRSAAFSPDGRLILTASITDVRVWDASTGAVIAKINIPEGEGRGTFTPDSRNILLTYSNFAELWDALLKNRVGSRLTHDSPVSAVAFSPDGSLFATASDLGTVQFWDTKTASPSLYKPLKLDGSVRSIVFDPTGRLVAVYREDTSTHAYQAIPYELASLKSLPFLLSFKPSALTHDDRILSMAFHRDATRFLTGSADWTAQVWDLQTRQHQSLPMRHPANVTSVSFHPDGAHILTVSGSAARIWTASGSVAPDLKIQEDDQVNGVQWSPDGRRVLSHTVHGARIHDAQTGALLIKMDHPDTLAASFSPDAHRVLTFSGDHQAQVWDADTGKPVGSPMTHPQTIRSAQFSPDGRRIVTASYDNTAQLWDADTGQPAAPPMTLDRPVSSAAFSPDGQTILTTSLDGTAFFWTAAGAPAGRSHEFLTSIGDAKFSPDGRRALVIADKTAYLLDPANAQPIGQPLTHQYTINAAVFSPDSRRVVTVSDDYLAQSWSAETGTPFGRPMVHLAPIKVAAFAPDSHRVFTAAKLGIIWDSQTGEPAAGNYTEEEIKAAAFSPDGTRLVLAHKNNVTIRTTLLPTKSPSDLALLRDWIAAAGGYRVTDSGSVDLLPFAQRLALIRRLRQTAQESPASPLTAPLRRFFSIH